MAILQATIIGLIVFAASVAAQVIATADTRLALPSSSQKQSRRRPARLRRDALL
jgi:hypothetical protein